jgi:hypothetical protein
MDFIRLHNSRVFNIAKALLLILLGAFLPLVAEACWQKPSLLCAIIVGAILLLIGFILWLEQTIQKRFSQRYDNIFNSYRQLEVSMECRILHTETSVLYHQAKNALPAGSVIVRAFLYAIRDNTFAPLAFYKEDGTFTYKSGSGDVDSRTKFNFDGARESKLVIWDAYVHGQAVKDISLEDTAFYTDKLRKRIDDKIRTVLAIVVKDRYGDKPLGLISFTCNYHMARVWDNDKIWDVAAVLADQASVLLSRLKK